MRVLRMKRYALTLLIAISVALLVEFGPISTWWPTVVLAWL